MKTKEEVRLQAKRLVARWARGWMVDARTDATPGRWTGTFLNGAIPDLEERIAKALQHAEGGGE